MITKARAKELKANRTKYLRPKIEVELHITPICTAVELLSKDKYRDNKLSFDESSRLFLGSLIRGDHLQGDDPQHRKDARSERKKLSNSYLTKQYVWPKRLLLTVLDDSLCVRGTSLGIKTKFMVLSLLESLCGTTYDKNAPTVGLQTFSVDSKLVLPLQRPETKRKLRHSVLAYTTEPVRHLQLDRALERTMSILNGTSYMFISIYLYIYLPIIVNIYLYIYLSLFIYISMFMSIHLSIFVHIYLSLFISIYISLFISISECLYLCSCLSIYLNLFISIYLSIYLS
ncbi:unnamed protein product [Acanthosepion pharaonis]|uniref:Uncharacterized protein n=1 Tax=Acanthosepion pharaonis TaxID=158019 RepID=A0A812DJ04_ACAPH|nr:unnamed protein product [Sepia pharaonis]